MLRFYSEDVLMCHIQNFGEIVTCSHFAFPWRKPRHPRTHTELFHLQSLQSQTTLKMYFDIDFSHLSFSHLSYKLQFLLTTNWPLTLGLVSWCFFFIMPAYMPSLAFILVSLFPQVFVCMWKGCKVYNTPSTSQSWLQRHMLTHSGDKPFKVKTVTSIQRTHVAVSPKSFDQWTLPCYSLFRVVLRNV